MILSLPGNRIRGDECRPQHRTSGDNLPAVFLDLGEMPLELQSASAGQPEVDQNPAFQLDEAHPEDQLGTPPVHGLDDVDAFAGGRHGVPQLPQHGREERVGLFVGRLGPESRVALHQPLVQSPFAGDLGLSARLGTRIEV